MDGIHTSEFKEKIYFIDGTAAGQEERRGKITYGLKPEFLLDLQKTLETNF